MGLVPLKRTEIDQKRETFRMQLRKLRGEPRKKVHCECGFSKDEGEMVCWNSLVSKRSLLPDHRMRQLQCDCCNAWQHYHCYGFTVELPRPGEAHFCYHCLLEGTDEFSLAKLRRLARFRRALWILYNEATGSLSQPAFGKLLRQSSLGFPL